MHTRDGGLPPSLDSGRLRRQTVSAFRILSCMKRHDTWPAIASLASQQLGLITRAQARSCGLTDRQVDGLAARGEWERVVPGVYRMAGAPPSWESGVLAPCLAHAPGATASLFTATRLHGLARTSPLMPDVCVPFERTSRVSGATSHRARLTPLDRTMVGPIPVTSIERTLVDLAGVVGPVRLRSIVDSAMHTGRITARSVDAAWDRSQRAPGRKGRANLMAALETWRPAIRPGSAAEARLLRQLRQWGYPEPDRQIVVKDASGTIVARLDAGWRDVRVGLEYDSEEWHGEDRWTHDEERHALVESLGWTLLRVDKIDLRAGERRFRRELEQAWPHRAA